MLKEQKLGILNIIFPEFSHAVPNPTIASPSPVSGKCASYQRPIPKSEQPESWTDPDGIPWRYCTRKLQHVHLRKNIHRGEIRWLRPLPKCAYRWRRLFDFWHPPRAWRFIALTFWGRAIYPTICFGVAPSMHQISCARFFFSPRSLNSIGFGLVWMSFHGNIITYSRGVLVDSFPKNFRWTPPPLFLKALMTDMSSPGRRDLN